MPGQPRRRAMLAEMSRRARAWGEIDDDAEPDLIGWLCAEMRNGETLAALARSMSERTGVVITREMMSRYVSETGEDSVRRLARARIESAEAHAELSHVELADADKETISVAREQSRARQWLAGAYDREQFGKTPAQVNVGISMTGLHLDALRAVPNHTHLPSAHAEITTLPSQEGRVPMLPSNASPTP